MKKDNLTTDCIFKSFKSLLEKKKYNEISVCDICEKAGVSRMTFYRSFNSKDDLTLKSIDRLVSNMRQRILSSNQVNHYTILKEVFDTFKPLSDVIGAFEDSQIVKEVLQTITEKLKDNIQASDYINKTSKYIPTFFFSGITSTLFEWIKGGTEESSEDMARLLTSLINFEVADEDDYENSPKTSLLCSSIFHIADENEENK